MVQVLEKDRKPALDEPVVRVRNLRKTFRREDGTPVKAIDGVDLDVLPGDFLVLLGPSGCGKTTLLRAIAGLERPNSGTIEIHGEVNFSSDAVIDRPPERRRLNMIFQSYALWPHMTAAKNVAFPLQYSRDKRSSKDEISERVHHVLSLVGIPELAGQYPSQMSGGQQQRVALARALVGGDGLILFDEPLSNVDAKVREQLRFELLSMQRELGFSAIFVTHDQVEAMELANRIAVMQEGRVAQLAPPEQIYADPSSRYVANFIGTSNEVEGTVRAVDGGRIRVETPLGELVGRSGAADLAPGDRVVASWRPERYQLSIEQPASGVNTMRGIVQASLFVGSHNEFVLSVGEHHFRLWSVDTATSERGTEVWLHVDPEHLRVLPNGDDGAGT